MIDMSVAEAYTLACEQLGDAQVRNEILARQLREVAAERDEAGARIVALASELEELRAELDEQRAITESALIGRPPPHIHEH